VLSRKSFGDCNARLKDKYSCSGFATEVINHTLIIVIIFEEISFLKRGSKPQDWIIHPVLWLFQRVSQISTRNLASQTLTDHALLILNLCDSTVERISLYFTRRRERSSVRRIRFIPRMCAVECSARGQTIGRIQIVM